MELTHPHQATLPKAISIGHETRPAASVLVIGLGNPILGDDGVGWKIAEEVTSRLGARDDVEVDCLAVGGLSLMERMLGYERVILVDSMETGERAAGTVTTLSLEDLRNPRLGHSASAHDASLATALGAARLMGASTPSRVDIVVVEAQTGLDFSEHLSPTIGVAVPVAAQTVMELLPTK
jgi:hydrogenase maturation protease